MGDVIILEERNVKPKGANKNDSINQEKLTEFFLANDYQQLNYLDKIKPLKIKNKLTLFYPGSGADILFPLIYLEKLFPKIKKAKFLFLDLDDSSGLIKTTLDDLGISFSGNKSKIKFYWKGKKIKLNFVSGDIFELIKDIPCFDVYFERAFRIMKEKDSNYEHQVFSKLNQGGVLISDSGFRKVPLKRIEVPLELSSYGEMVIGIKNI